eukprot:TRINITY_DN9610_c0_g1_i1.p1 TRINITY_DN9610_c0_g1~~TRINITY_DN9610_c0_g1_i1.p1  ORF type:complete len:122 (-),score=10.80 TRINITY_DN9610_c0_g1_i1:22-363(-)
MEQKKSKVASLLSICITYVALSLRTYKELSLLPTCLLSRLLQKSIHHKQLTNETLRLFLAPDLTSLNLDFTGPFLNDEALEMVISCCPGLTDLDLKKNLGYTETQLCLSLIHI